MTASKLTEHRSAGIRWFRWMSLFEGSSLLMLLLVAMPLKYAFGIPLAVRIVGSLHGVLFLALLALAFQVLLETGVSKGVVGRVVALSIVPFGFVWADRLLRRAAPISAEPSFSASTKDE